MTARRPPRLPPLGETLSTGDNNSGAVDRSASSSTGSSSTGSSSTGSSSTSARSAAPPAGPGPGVLPAQAHLSDRDRQIADWLDRHGVLTTAQITAAFFASPITAAHRLAKLRALTLIDRFHRPLSGGGFGPWHWVIGPLGAEVAAAARNEPAPTRRALRRRHARLADSSHLAHLLGTNQFFINLHTHARCSGGTAQLRLWWSERDSVDRFLRRVRPDGHALWREGGTTIGLFLEYDTAGAESLARLVEKLDTYDDLVRDGGPAYPVLFWLHATNRETHLHQMLTDRGPGLVPVATGVHDHVGVDPAGPVWRLAGDPRPARRRLAELPSRHGRPDSIYNPHADSLAPAG